ncbi:MAG TPA: type II secretion system F family protein [Verrucomicrobiales bacterium]|nr:type II secretion system F family protein [Verrucomicrobiales bacterium]
MASFDYRAIGSDGVISDGNLQAGGRQEAFRQIEDQGLKTISLSENSESPNAPKGNSSLLFRKKKISFRMLEDFTRLLSSLLASGIPLSRALVILHREADAPVAEEKWKEVHDLVVDGMSLADAMAKSPETFPSVYVAMVEAGEVGGFLEVVLQQVAEFQSRDQELRAKVFTAMIYPVVLFCLAMAVLVFLMVFFIPRFQPLFEGFDANLPILTQIIVGISEFIQHYGFVIFAGAAFGVYLARRWLTSEAGHRKFDTFLLKFPVIGPLNAKFAMARFCRMLGTLLGSGVPMIQGLNVARRSIGNQILVDTVGHSIEAVKKGEPLAKSLSNCRSLFRGSVLEIISVAEESGRLDQELIRLAGVTEGDLDRQLKTAVALMEPLMLFLIAGFIGTIFVGMVLPIFTIQDYIK